MREAHRAWVKAAIADHLGLPPNGGTVTLNAEQLDALAEAAGNACLNWVVGAAKEGMIEHHCTSECDH